MAFNAAPGTVAPDEPGPYGVYGKSARRRDARGRIADRRCFRADAFAGEPADQRRRGSVERIESQRALFDFRARARRAAAARARRRGRYRQTSAEQHSARRGLFGGPAARHADRAIRTIWPPIRNSPQARRVRAILAARREAIFWRRSVNENSPRAYWTYLRLYPNGPHVCDAAPPLEILPRAIRAAAGFRAGRLCRSAAAAARRIASTTPARRSYFDGPDYGPPPPPPPLCFPARTRTTTGATCRRRRRRLPLAILPVLAVAIPLLVGAKVFHDRRGGVAQQNGLARRRRCRAASGRAIAPPARARCRRRPRQPPRRCCARRAAAECGQDRCRSLQASARRLWLRRRSR